MSKSYAPFLLGMAILVMCLAVYAVPFPGSLILIAAAGAGACIGVAQIRRREKRDR